MKTVLFRTMRLIAVASIVAALTVTPVLAATYPSVNSVETAETFVTTFEGSEDWPSRLISDADKIASALDQDNPDYPDSLSEAARLLCLQGIRLTCWTGELTTDSDDATKDAYKDAALLFLSQLNKLINQGGSDDYTESSIASRETVAEKLAATFTDLSIPSLATPPTPTPTPTTKPTAAPTVPPTSADGAAVGRLTPTPTANPNDDKNDAPTTAGNALAVVALIVSIILALGLIGAAFFIFLMRGQLQELTRANETSKIEIRQLKGKQEDVVGSNSSSQQLVSGYIDKLKQTTQRHTEEIGKNRAAIEMLESAINRLQNDPRPDDRPPTTYASKSYEMPRREPVAKRNAFIESMIKDFNRAASADSAFTHNDFNRKYRGRIKGVFADNIGDEITFSISDNSATFFWVVIPDDASTTKICYVIPSLGKITIEKGRLEGFRSSGLDTLFNNPWNNASESTIRLVEPAIFDYNDNQIAKRPKMMGTLN